MHIFHKHNAYKTRHLFIFSAISCGIAQPPGNGSVSGNEFTLGSKVIYECNEGYRLQSSQQSTAVCQEDGSWSNAGKPPVCQRKCIRMFLIFF